MKRENNPKITDKMVGSDEINNYCGTVVDKMVMAGEHEGGGEEVTGESAGVNEVDNSRCSAGKHMKRASTIIIGFLHDSAVGCWAATVLAVYWLDRLSFERLELQPALGGLKKEFFYIGLVCVAVVLLAGVGRTFTYAYIGSVYGKDAEKLRRKMLIVKHIILFSVFGAGIYWQYTMVFR